MSRNNEDPGRLSVRDKELVALGAAIASNCIPCVEYHIPQARKAGLSDSEIREAVTLADKVRQVPAGKVRQTAHALLKAEDRTRTDEGKGHGCGCPGETRDSVSATATGPAESHGNDVGLDSDNSEEDNKTKKKCCGSGSGEAEAGARTAAD